MAGVITCECGKQFPWKAELAGKRGRCKCGQIVAFSTEPPPADSFDLADIAELEATGQPMAVAPPPAVARPSNLRQSPTAKPAGRQPSTLLAGLGLLALGLVLLGVFVIWPMARVLQHERSISISFKGILLSVFATLFGLYAVIVGDKIPLKRGPGQPPSLYVKVLMGVIVGIALLTCGILWYFFDQHGYSIKF